MAVKLISVECPKCGAALEIEENRQQAFCTYCGAKVLVHNENEYIFRTIDEAAVKRAETDQIVRMKQLELDEEKRQEAKKAKKKTKWISLVVGTIGILMMAVGIFAYKAIGFGYFSHKRILLVLSGLIVSLFAFCAGSDSSETGNKVDLSKRAIVPWEIRNFEEKSYTVIEALFTNAGFTNVKCVPLNDLSLGIFKKSGTVETITIKGCRVRCGGGDFPKDTPVLIMYHSVR